MVKFFFFAFRFSLFIFRFLFSLFIFRYLFFTFHYSLFVFRFSFFAFRFFHSKSGQISYFDIQNPIFTLEIVTNIVLWHSKSYFDNRTWDEFHIVTFIILFWHSNWGQISYFDIQYPILTFIIEPNVGFWYWKILFWHSISDRISYFDIQILFWHSNWGGISYFDI